MTAIKQPSTKGQHALILTLLNDVALSHLDPEYAHLFKKMLHDVMDAGIELSGKPQSWAAAIAYLVVSINDRVRCELTMAQLTKAFAVTDSAMRNRVRSIDMYLQLDENDSMRPYVLAEILQREQPAYRASLDASKHMDFFDMDGMDESLIEMTLMSPEGVVNSDEPLPPEVEEVIKQLQDGMDELSLKTDGFDMDDVKVLVSKLGMQLMSGNDLYDIDVMDAAKMHMRQSKAGKKRTRDTALTSAEKKAPQVISITAVKVPVTNAAAKKSKQDDAVLMLKDIEPASESIH